MSATIIDGKTIASSLRARVAAQTAVLKERHGIVPGLAVILVGDDAASAAYVKSKGRATIEAGFHAFDIRLPAATAEHTLLDQVRALNADSSVHGILVQMPLPDAIDPRRVIATIDPLKDVDGLTDVNQGRLLSGEYGARRGLVPCTPLGSLMLIQSVLGKNLAGLSAVVVGRSNLVGKPMAQLLIQADCTVTIAHSKTRDVPALARNADILIAAAGRPAMVPGSWIKPGSVVIDVGINRVTRDGRSVLVGDVAFEDAVNIAGSITPVPGGVGPMTIACLMRNTLMAACLQAGLPAPEL